jgi:hypothetical protein
MPCTDSRSRHLIAEMRRRSGSVVGDSVHLIEVECWTLGIGRQIYVSDASLKDVRESRLLASI